MTIIFCSVEIVEAVTLILKNIVELFVSAELTAQGKTEVFYLVCRWDSLSEKSWVCHSWFWSD